MKMMGDNSREKKDGGGEPVTSREIHYSQRSSNSSHADPNNSFQKMLLSEMKKERWT